MDATALEETKATVRAMLAANPPAFPLVLPRVAHLWFLVKCFNTYRMDYHEIWFSYSRSPHMMSSINRSKFFIFSVLCHFCQPHLYYYTLLICMFLVLISKCYCSSIPS